MTTLDLFAYEGHEIRTKVIDGEPCVLLADVIVGLDMKSTPGQVAQRLPDGVRRMDTILDRLGRTQVATYVTEAGLYRVVLRSDSPKAEPFLEWVTSDVLPTIRKTGRYGSDLDLLTQLPSSELLMLASQAAKRAEEAEAKAAAEHARAAELEAPAGAWLDLAGAKDDVTISEAAKVLARAGISTGPKKLHGWLEVEGWIFRRAGKPVAYQTAVNAGLLVEKVGDYRGVDGDRKLTTQVRVTPKGLERMRELLGAQRELAMVEGGA